jgi:hypothetical protein
VAFALALAAGIFGCLAARRLPDERSIEDAALSVDRKVPT